MEDDKKKKIIQKKQKSIMSYLKNNHKRKGEDKRFPKLKNSEPKVRKRNRSKDSIEVVLSKIHKFEKEQQKIEYKSYIVIKNNKELHCDA